ncbi:hypothetical protein [Neobacillus sp. CF12]|nr:hypothetical protein [Neobacillus sp. CF12]
MICNRLPNKLLQPLLRHRFTIANYYLLRIKATNNIFNTVTTPIPIPTLA